LVAQGRSITVLTAEDKVVKSDWCKFKH
jgi:hypothetical protein